MPLFNLMPDLMPRIVASEQALAAMSPPRRFAASFGGGILTSFDFTHGFGTLDVLVQCYLNATGAGITPLTVQRLDTNTVRVTIALAVGANVNRIVILA